MKTIILAFLLATTFVINKADATNLRGRVVRLTNGQYYPLSEVRVDLYFWNNGTKKWDNISYAVTGADGFYYFVNISPGATFCFSVMSRFYPAQPLTVANLPPANYQDLPLIIT